MSPTSEADSGRREPPGMTIVTPGESRNSKAMKSPLVTTVSSRWSFRWRAACQAVVLASSAIASPSRTRAAAARPMRSFSGRCSSLRSAKAGKSLSVSVFTTAPPWVRTKRPCRSKVARSFRTVTGETSNLSLSSATDTLPCRYSRFRIWSSRSCRNSLWVMTFVYLRLTLF